MIVVSVIVFESDIVKAGTEARLAGVNLLLKCIVGGIRISPQF